jgi:hypothetical protein
MPTTKFINECVTKALSSEEMLTIREFIKYIDYPIDAFTMDHTWHSLEDGLLIYVDDKLIGWMGFSSEDPLNRKIAFTKALGKASVFGSDYLSLSNVEYKEYLKNSVIPAGMTEMYPNVDNSNGKGKTKHILITSKCLKDVLMQLHNDQAARVRQYYAALEDLLRIYDKYQTVFRERQFKQILAQSQQQITLYREEAEKAIVAAEHTRVEADRLRLEIAEKETRIARVTQCNVELMNYKLFLNKTETLYIASTESLARQGLFKVGRTINVKSRAASLNTSHPSTDKFVMLHEIKCGSSKQLELRAAHVLQHVRYTTDREFYKIPFNMLVKILTKLEDDLNADETMMNDLVKILEEFKYMRGEIDWMNGIPADKFLIEGAPSIKAIIDAPERLLLECTPSEPVAITDGNDEIMEILRSFGLADDASNNIVEDMPTEEAEVEPAPAPAIPAPADSTLTIHMTINGVEIDIILQLKQIAGKQIVYQIDVNNAIKDALALRRKKTGYKFTDWKPHINDCISKLGVTIKSRK